METKLVPGVGRLPYPAYRGEEPFVFISYAHDDQDKVFAEIKRFNEAGFHVWYDEGISPGNEWTDEIADALDRCSLFVVMITPTSAPRPNVLNEINYALDENKPFLAIHLEETAMKGGLKLRTGSKQAILKYNMTEEEYEYKYIEAFTRLGLKRGEVTIKQLDDLVKNFLGTNQAVSQKEAAKAGEEFYDDSPEDAQKRANGDLVRVDGFDIEHGLLRGYYGSAKDITTPNAARIITSSSFERCRSFIESVDLNNAGKIIAGLFGTFSNCPELKTVKIPATVEEVTPDMFHNCPNLTVYVRRSQVSADFEERFTGKGIVYLDDAADVPASQGNNSWTSEEEKPAATVQPVFQPKGTAKISTTDGSLTVPANSLFSAAAASIVLRPLTEWNDDKKDLPDYKEILKLTVEDFEDDNSIHKIFHITKNDGTVIKDDVMLAYDSRLGFCESGKTKRISWREVNAIEMDRTVDCMQDWGEYARIHMRNGEVIFVPAFSLTMGVSKRPKPDSWSYSSSLTWPEKFRTGRGTQFSLSELSSISFGEVTYEMDKWEDNWIKELPVGLTYKDGRRLRTDIKEDYLKLFAIDDFGVIELMPDKIDHIAFVNDIAEEIFVETPPAS